MTHSPSKHINLKRLKQIKKDNYIAESGKEYSEIETQAMIIEKENTEAIKMVSMAQSKMKMMAVNSLLGKKKIMFPIDMDKERNF